MDQDQTPNPDQDTSGSGPDKTEKTVPYARFQAVNDAKKQAEETLTGLVAELVEDIPEQFRSLVPDIAPAEKVKWIRTAQKTGLFTAKSEPTGPDAKRPSGRTAPDFTGMTSYEKMSAGYGQTK